MADLAEVIAGFAIIKKGKRKDGLTVEELSLETGLRPEKVRERLRLLLAAGRLEVTRKPGIRLDGKPMLVPAYRVVDAKGGKKK